MQAYLRPLFKGITGKGFLGQIIPYRLVLWQLVIQHLTLRYRRTVLGFIWTLVNPLLTMTVTATVFSFVMKIPVKNYPVFLFAGTIPWIFFSNCILQGGMSIILNEGLIKKIYVPRHIFPISVITALLLENILSTVALFVIALALGAKLTLALWFLPVSFVLLYVFSLGLGMLFSVVFVYLRDMQQVANVFLQVLYYATPILYPLSMVSPKIARLLRLNPLTYFMQLFQAPIYMGALPPVSTIAAAALLAVAAFALGWAVFRACANQLVFRL